MNNHVDIKVLDKLGVVNLNIHIWSARKKLTPDDIGSAELPPDELASLGSKRICNPEELRTFNTLKARAANLLDRVGVRFLSGWAVPEDRLQDTAMELGKIQREFDAAKESFLMRYDQVIQAWIASHPQWATIISSSVVNADYVRCRIGFSWQMFKVASPPEELGMCNDSLVNATNDLAHTLFDEIAHFAKETWQRCYEGKVEVTRKALSPLKTMYEKLKGLAFIEPRVSPVTEMIDMAMRNIPKRGAITGPRLLMLQGLLLLLSTPQVLREHGQKILDGVVGPGEVLQSLLAETPQVTEKNMQFTKPELGKSVRLDSRGLW